MIRPATPEDLFALVVRGNEAQNWFAVLAADNLPDIIAQNKMVVGLRGDTPYFCVGVGRLPLAGTVLPWVWATIDVSARHYLRDYIRHDRQAVVAYLDENASLAYTAPEGDNPVYSRFLEWTGFRHLGWGLWQWPSSAQQSQG